MLQKYLKNCVFFCCLVDCSICSSGMWCMSCFIVAFESYILIDFLFVPSLSPKDYGKSAILNERITFLEYPFFLFILSLFLYFRALFWDAYIFITILPAWCIDSLSYEMFLFGVSNVSYLKLYLVLYHYSYFRSFKITIFSHPFTFNLFVSLVPSIAIS